MNDDKPVLGRAFRVLQCAVGTSDLGDGAFYVLAPLVGLLIDRSPMAIALVSLCLRLPGPLIAVPISHLLDLSSRRLLISFGSAVIRVIAVAALFALTAAHALDIGLLCLLSFITVAASNSNDLAIQSSVPECVDKASLPKANAWIYTTQVVLVQMVGPAFAGVVIGRLDQSAALALILALFVVAMLIFGQIAFFGRRNPIERSSTRVGGVLYGFSYIFNDKHMFRLAMSAALNNLCYAMTFTFLSAWIVSPGPVGGSAEQYGWTVAATAVGSLLGGLLGGRGASILSDEHVTRYAFLVTAFSFSLVLTGNIVLITLGMVVYGAAVTTWSVRVISQRQSSLPADVFGRVNGAFRWFSLSAPPIGAVLAGLIAHYFGIRMVFIVAVVPCYLGALISWIRPAVRVRSAAE